MFRSILLKRIIITMLAVLFLTAALTSVLYLYASDHTLEVSRGNEMQARAKAIVSYYDGSSSPQIDPSVLNTCMTDRNIAGSYFLVYDANRSLLAQSQELTATDTDVLSRLKTYLDQNLLSGTDTAVKQSIIVGQDAFSGILVVQAPIEASGTISGYIVLASPMADMHSISHELLKSLLLAFTIASLFMLIPLYFIIYRLVRPLQKINDVARTMVQGDSFVRANTKPKGEIGELARSFNEQADKLSNSISDLTIERNRLREIFDVISEGIVSVDLELRPLYSNPAILTLFENAKRKNLFTDRLQLIPFDEVWDDFKNCIAEGKTIERTLEARDNAYLSTVVPTFDNNQHVAGATGFFRDITESERLEQTRRDYVANVSHELRTPLTALRGLVEPLADGMVRSEHDRMRYYGIILHETMRLSRLIDDMLELSRLQARTLAFKTFPFDLNVLLTDLEAKFAPVMSDASITFRIDCKSGPNPTVTGNPDRVEQILVILMDNAKKYTPPGGSITITTETSEERDLVFVSVIDTGQGIHEYDIDHIFDRFYKADRARGKKGTGLGLSIAKELLNYMGETISVQSDYGEGTTFTFTLKRIHGTMWY